MAGALTIDTLNSGTGVLATQNGMTGVAKAWVNYNGAAQSIRSSFNVSSVTRNGTGDYTVNFTTAMPDANYAVTGMTGYTQGTAGNATTGAVFISEGYPLTTTYVRVRVITATSTLTDNGTTTVTVNGN
jgi:hypothetical protein